MNIFARLSILICLIAQPLLPAVAYAESNVDVNVSGNDANSHNSVHVESNTGNNTICHNGQCTTTSNNNGSSKVCVNGKCYTDDDGKLDVEDGNTSVHINNSTGTTTVNQTTNNAINTSVNTTVDEDDSISDNDDDEDNQASKTAEKKKEIKQKIADNRNAIQKLVDEIKDIFKNLHIF